MNGSVFVSSEECSRHQISPGVSIRTAAGREMMLSDVTLAPNAVVEPHSHPHEQVGMVLEGEALFCVGSEQKRLTPGEMYFIPGGVEHKVIAGENGCRALDVFHPIREDYL